MKTKRIFTIGLLAVVAATTGAVVAQTPQLVGTWAPLRELTTPLSGGASLALPDGRTLIAGGTAAGNTPIDGVTIYDAVNDALIRPGSSSSRAPVTRPPCSRTGACSSWAA